MKIQVGILFISCLVASSRAAESVPENDALISMARTLRTQNADTNKKADVDLLLSRAKASGDSKSIRFATLLDGYISLDVQGGLTNAEKCVAFLAKGKDVPEWEMYFVRMLQASVEGKSGNYHDAQQSMEWLTNNVNVIKEGSKTNELCAALVEGIERGRGPIEAGLRIAEAGILMQLDRRDEAKLLFASVIRDFPHSDWAISARNRLHHLNNEASVKKAMEEKYTSGDKRNGGL